MAAEKINTTAEDVRVSIGSLYSAFKREKDAKEEAKKQIKKAEKEERKAEKDAEREESEEERQLSKKEKLESDLNSWQSVVVGLWGDDIKYVSKKKGKKKYRRWIGDEDVEQLLSASKPKKKKKKDFQKEFQPELTMLSNIITDQNKFIADLAKRYQNAAGPLNAKEMQPINKNLIELAAVLNNARGNSLGLLREVSGVKKTIADLYNKQKDFEAKYGRGGEGYEGQDLGLMGSDLASSLFGNAPYTPMATSPSDFTHSTPVPGNVQTHNSTVSAYPNTGASIRSFDPETWDGDGLGDVAVHGESIPHTVVVEWHKSENKARFKAVRNDNGEEIHGTPGLPTCKVSKIDEDNKVARDEFDQTYKLEIIE